MKTGLSLSQISNYLWPLFPQSFANLSLSLSLSLSSVSLSFVSIAIMLVAQLSVRTLSGVVAVPDQANAGRTIGNPSVYLRSWSFRCSSVIPSSSKRFRGGLKSPTIAIRCDASSSSSSSRGGFGGRSGNGGDRDDGEYLEASLLLSETVSHYRMRRRGFQEDTRGKLFPFSVQKKDSQTQSLSRADVNFVGQAFLQRFQYPTIFLKISCDGDFLLPIVVGEFAIEKLLDAHWGDENEGSPDQFKFLRNLVDKLGYQVNMVQITERVVNTYFARLFFSKPGEKEILSVDVRPSDAINVANRCKAPIYVNKQIVLMDAIRISYGMGRVRDTKSTYDVSLDSAVDGPDFLSQELHLVKNIDLAVKEERYKDAAMWKDKLLQLRKSIHGH